MIGIIDFKHHFTSSIIPVRSHIVKLDQQEIPGISYLVKAGDSREHLAGGHPRRTPPFSKVIHIGDNLFISYANILEYLFQDPDTKVIIMYIKKSLQTLLRSRQNIVIRKRFYINLWEKIRLMNPNGKRQAQFRLRIISNYSNLQR